MVETGSYTTSNSAGASLPPSSDRLLYVALIAGSAALGGFLFGFDTAVINSAITGVQDRFSIGAGATGLIVSSALIGCAVGAWFAGSLADRFGRVRTMQFAALLYGIGALAAAMSFSAVDLVFWRVTCGLGIGLASVTGPAYIAEISPAAYRGRLGSLQQLGMVTGIASAALLNYGIVAVAGGSANPLGPFGAWQWMLGIAVVPAAIFGILVSRIPESPRHLVSKNRFTQAREVLDRIEPGAAEERLGEIRRSLEHEPKPRLRHLFGGRRTLLPIVWVGIGLSMLQQFVGINVIFYYSATLWQSVGIGEDAALLNSVVSAVVNILGTFLAIALIDRVGRRPILFAGSIGMSTSLGIAAWCFGYSEVIDGATVLPDPQGQIAFIAANAFVFFFAASWGPLVWVLLGEMFPNRIRAAALSVAAAAQWMSNWVVSMSFPSLSEFSLTFAYGLYTTFALLSFFFVLKFVPETKGKTLEEMG
ncbi:MULTISPECIES: sugar porter family MFS transporter [Actinoalloteichus]|uniref:MFS transporter, sugar porter family n=1 Tax=Actinoalloteichus fjordicus TaxID=1612552 RepID=A0AAC9LKK0_9PSEU|nr:MULTISPECIES: sugar porter family MFS transporter [Actinoalloteichus]APU17950.1 MFS transporter, sugar porter family [Actinoalloteichus fjordicus]APU24029.1 MFS transporter, sugar porter family [Actinoalloteichus sp. GBA129-24]